MSTSIGKIGLDLGVNYKPFQRELGGIAGRAGGIVKSAFGKIGLLVGSAFATKSLVDFGKSAISMASDLTEVQNVVDITFGSMAESINNFSKTALEQFGLSELSAKTYTSTMGAMLKSSGITGQAMRDMSIELAKLTADMASFYNLDYDVAFNKLRSGISGETEPLKQLGINLNVANVEAYALSQGITKSYKSMSQAEQTLLRYNYLLHVTKDAQGDFYRNIGTWANQTKILGEQWKIFQSTMGQGLINIFTPIIKVINGLIKRLQVAAAYFKAFTTLIFGDATGSAESASTAVGGVADSFDDVSGSMDGAGKSAKKAGKEMQKLLAPFDEITNITQDASGGLGGLGDELGGGLGDLTIPEVDIGIAPADKIDEYVTNADKALKKLSKTLSNIYNDWGVKDIFQGIKQGIATIDFSGIRDNFVIFASGLGEILKSFIPNIQMIAQSLGKAIGIGLEQGIALVGNIFEPISQGFADFMANNKDTIIQRWDDIFLNLNDGITNIGMIFDELGTILNTSVENSQTNIATFIEGLLTNISETSLLFNEIWTDMFRMASEEVLTFIQDNEPALQEFSEGLIEMFTDTGDLLNQIWGDSLDSIKQFWDEWGSDFVEGVGGVLSDIGEWFLYLYNDIVKPVWDAMMEWLTKIWNDNLKGIVDEFLGFLGRVWEIAMLIWNKALKPLVDLILKVFGPRITNTLNFLVDVFGALLNGITGVIKGILRVLNGILDFIIGVFTGDWERAWKGVKDIFGGIVDGLAAIFKVPLNWIISGINTFIRGLNRIKIPDFVPVIGGKGFNIKQIPYLARGGIIDEPTLAMVGERNKKEAVVPLEDTSFATTFANAIANAIINTLGPMVSGESRSFDRPVEIVINLGGSTIFRKIVEGINTEMLMSGQLIFDL